MNTNRSLEFIREDSCPFVDQSPSSVAANLMTVRRRRAGEGHWKPALPLLPPIPQPHYGRDRGWKEEPKGERQPDVRGPAPRQFVDPMAVSNTGQAVGHQIYWRRRAGDRHEMVVVPVIPFARRRSQLAKLIAQALNNHPSLITHHSVLHCADRRAPSRRIHFNAPSHRALKFKITPCPERRSAQENQQRKKTEKILRPALHATILRIRSSETKRTVREVHEGTRMKKENSRARRPRHEKSAISRGAGVSPAKQFFSLRVPSCTSWTNYSRSCPSLGVNAILRFS
jgi:hypothetical protein